MRIAFFVDSFPSVTQTFILNQITGLLDRGHDIQIFSRRTPDSDIQHKRIREYDLLDRTTYLPVVNTYARGASTICRTTPQLLRNREFADLWALLSTGKLAPQNLATYDILSNSDEFDAYHAHFGTLGRFARPVTTRFAAPFVVSFYGVDASRLPRENPGMFDATFSDADCVTVLSEDMREQLIEIGCTREKTRKVPLSVDTSQFEFHERTLPDGSPTKLLTVARFVEKKGLTYAIEAVAKLASEFNVRYSIIGDGPLRDEIGVSIRSHGIEDVVELRGWQDQEAVQQALQDAHVFLLPSVTTGAGDKEGTPTVLLEAQASGLPVVSTTHAGIPEIVADGESGILVPERDVDALTRALREVLRSPDDWSDFGTAGRKLVEENHNIDTVAGKLEELYAQLN